MLNQTQMQVVGILEDARERIMLKKNWTPGAYGVDKNRRVTNGLHDDDVKWCAIGTLRKSMQVSGCGGGQSWAVGFNVWGDERYATPNAVIGGHVFRAVRDAVVEMNLLPSSLHHNPYDIETIVTYVNDSLGHDKVLRMFEIAIDNARNMNFD